MSRNEHRYPSKQKSQTPPAPVAAPAPSPVRASPPAPQPAVAVQAVQAVPAEERTTEKRLTRSQRDLLLAEKLVTEAGVMGREAADIYGGLCHSFPVLVRTCGLCQALAFHKSKAAGDGDRGKAHKMLLDHVGKVLGVKEPLDAVRQADVTAYMLHTRRVLAAWIYFKRFSVSILKVDNSQAAQEGPAND